MRTLVDDDQAPNSYDIPWDGTDNWGRPIASGIYFYRLSTVGFKATKKMVLLK